MNAQLSSLMEKEVSRKEFLGMSGLALASIFGFGSFIKLLTGKSLTGSRHHAAPSSYGYGASVYGGAKAQ